MTFEELKFLILDKQRKTEINKLFHLYVKAQSYVEILQLLKSEANFKWILQNGFLDYVQYFPDEDLVNQNIYVSKEVELTDMNSDIILLNGSFLNLNQTGNNRCKVTIENAVVNVNISDHAMVEIESFQISRADLTVNNTGWGYCYLTARNKAEINLNGSGKSTFAITAYQDSKISANLVDDSYIYTLMYDSSILYINSNNFNGKKNDKSRIIIR